jgi:hypothetical protein
MASCQPLRELKSGTPSLSFSQRIYRYFNGSLLCRCEPALPVPIKLVTLAVHIFIIIPLFIRPPPTFVDTTMPGRLSILACIWVPVAAIRGVKATSASSAHVYTFVDDASWAINSKKVSDKLSGHIPSLYTRYIEECTKAALLTNEPTACEDVEDFRLNMNINQPKSVYNYTKVGYQKIKAPVELYKLLRGFYDKNRGKDETEWDSINSYHNMWESPPSLISLDDDQLEGGGPELRQQIQSLAKSLLQEWSGQELSLVSLYGVRLYHNGSILAPQ